MSYCQRGGLTIHEDRLCNVVGVVAGDDVVDLQQVRAAVEGLAAEDATVGAVALLADLGNDLVHRPTAVQLLV